VHTRFLDAVKTFEGFAKQSSWDYAQHTNGFGTKALYPGEQITLEEANRRFSAEIEQARKFVDSHAKGWDEGTKAALTSLTFNAGTRWASSGLGEAVRSLDIDAVRSQFLEYTKAGGEVLPGLVKRRLAEVTWIGEGVPSSPSVVTKGSLPGPSSPASPAMHVAAADPPSVTVSQHATPHTASTEFATGHAINQSPTEARDAITSERASSVAWMLLALDMKSFHPRLAADRNRDTTATS